MSVGNQIFGGDTCIHRKCSRWYYLLSLFSSVCFKMSPSMKMSRLEPEGRCLGWGGHPSQVALPATVTSPPMPTAPHARNTFGPGHTSPSLAHLFFANWFLCWQFRQTLKLKRLIYPWIPKDLNLSKKWTIYKHTFYYFLGKKKGPWNLLMFQKREHFCQTNASPAKLVDAFNCILQNCRCIQLHFTKSDD